MGLFSSTTFKTLDDLLLHEIKDLYDCEKKLVSAIPKMMEKAKCQHLKSALAEHLEQTKTQVRRLESAFKALGISPSRENCEAIDGLIAEAEEILSASGDEDVIDAAIIAAAQRVEHYEIAGYGTARTFARQLGRDDIAQWLQESLNEEGEADKALTRVAERSVNPASANA